MDDTFINSFNRNKLNSNKQCYKYQKALLKWTFALILYKCKQQLNLSLILVNNLEISISEML